MAEDRVLTYDELVRFVNESPIFYFNRIDHESKPGNAPDWYGKTDQVRARNRMVRFLSAHPALAPFMVDADNRFRQLFPGRRGLQLEARHSYDVYRGRGPDPARYDNAAMGPLYLAAELDMWANDYKNSAAGQEFEEWKKENCHRAPADFTIAIFVYA